MRNHVIVALLLLVAVPSHADDERALRALINTYTATVGTLDMEKIQSIWATEGDISFIHPRGHQTGWADIHQAFYIDTMGRFAERQLTAHSIDIRITSATSAWGDFYWNFEAAFSDGTPIATEGRETQIWEKIDGRWKILHVHYSGLPVTGDRRARRFLAAPGTRCAPAGFLFQALG